MRRVIVRYRCRPDQVARNEELVRAVYAELDEREPAGLRYATFRLDDGVTFVHIAEVDGEENPLGAIGAFGEFTAGIEDRCEEPPKASTMHRIGSFRMFAAAAGQTR
jgi:hypothetical protein